MSLGYGVGDFIAIGELCWKVYREVYEVSRDAPAEVQSLQKDLSNLSNIIKSLVEDVQNPDSALVSASSDRIKLTNDVMEKTRLLLSDLEELLKKYNILQSSSSGKKHFWKVALIKLQYVKEARTIASFRAKIEYHIGLLTLLLLAGNNSSLERIQSQNAKLISSVEEIKASMFDYGPVKAPVVSGHYDQKFQFDVTQKMMENAELNGTSWSSIGLDNWLQVGKWWFMKAQAHLYITAPRSQEHCQAYVNLLKASWVLVDIIAVHPQINFVSSGTQQLNIQRLGEAIRSEYSKYNATLPQKPTPQQMRAADFTIWGAALRTLLMPLLSDPGRTFLWKTETGDILFQQFGHFYHHLQQIEIECLVLLESDPAERKLTLVVQTSEGQDLVRYSKPISDRIRDRSLGGSILSPPVELAGERRWRMKFSHPRDARADAVIFSEEEPAWFLLALVEGINLFSEAYPECPFEQNTLQSGALLAYSQYRANIPPDSRHGKPCGADLELLDRLVSKDRSPEAIDDLWELTHSAICIKELPPSYWTIHAKRVPIAFLLAWLTPSSSLFLETMDCFAPSGWFDRVGEPIQAAIYKDDIGLLLSILHHHDIIKTAFVDENTKDSSSLSRILHKHLKIIQHHAGPHALMWASLQTQDVELLETSWMLRDLEKFKEYDIRHDCLLMAIETRSTKACSMLLECPEIISNVLPHTLLIASLRAIRLEFLGGLAYTLAWWMYEPYQEYEFLIMPALLTYNVHSIKALQNWGLLAGYMEESMDLTNEPWVADICQPRSLERMSSPHRLARTFTTMRPRSERGKDEIALDLSNDYLKWSLYSPILFALVFTCPPDVISCLSLQQCPRNQPGALQYLGDCSTLDSATAHYYELYQAFRKDLMERWERRMPNEYLHSIVVGEQLGLKYQLRGMNAPSDAPRFRDPKYYDPLEIDESSQPVLPGPLRSEEAFNVWRHEVLEILGNAA